MSATFEKAQDQIWSIIESGVKKGDSFAKIKKKVFDQVAKENGGTTWKDDVGPFKSWVANVLKSNENEIKKNGTLAKINKVALRNVAVKGFIDAKKRKQKMKDAKKMKDPKTVKKVIGKLRNHYQSAPAFDSFPKESQEKDHPLYGNLRY